MESLCVRCGWVHVIHDSETCETCPPSSELIYALSLMQMESLERMLRSSSTSSSTPQPNKDIS